MDLPDIDEENAKLSNGNDLPDIDEENASVGVELPDIDEVNRSIPPPTWEGGDGGAATLPDGQTNQWGGNLRNEGRKVLFRRDKAGKVNGYSTTSSMLVKNPDGRFAVVPTVVDGKELSLEDAAKHYSETGEHWGMADDEDSARNMAREVHETHMKANQEKWNDWVHEHWDEVSDEIRNDRRMDYEHRKRSAPDSVSRLERWSFGEDIPVPDEIGEDFYERQSLMQDIDLDIDDELKLLPSQRSKLKRYADKRLAKRLREAITYMAQQRMREIPIEREREEREKKAREEAQGKETGHLENVRNVFSNIGLGSLAGVHRTIGTILGGESATNPEYVTERMVDHPLAKKEGEDFESWYYRVREQINPKKQMPGESKEAYHRRRFSDYAIRSEARKYFDWAAPIAGKEKMQREVLVEKGASPRDWHGGTGIGNFFLDLGGHIQETLDEDYAVGRTGNVAVDWLSNAATGIGKFGVLNVASIPVFANDAYLNTQAAAIRSGQSFDKAERLALTAEFVDGALTAAFYAAPFKRWFNSKGITPVQRVASGSFSDMSRGMGRYFAKKELLNSGVAALEAGGIMGVQGAADTAIAQLAQGQDIDLGEITVGGLKGVRDGVLISAVMGGARIVNARIKGAKEYEKIVRAAAQTPEGRLRLATLNPDGMMDLKRFIQEGAEVAKQFEKPAADFEAGTTGKVSEGRRPAPDWEPTKETVEKFRELCDKAGLPADAKLATDILFDANVSQFLGDALKSKFTRAANVKPEPALPEKPIIDGETGEVIKPSEALARRVRSEFGEEPVHFDIPQTPEGKPELVPMKWRDNKTGKENTSRLAHDAKTGVTVMEESDGSFSIYNETGDSDGAATLDEALEKAQQLALMGQYTKLDRERKRRVIENERETKYGKKNVAYFNTMADAAAAFENGIAREGSLFGLQNAEQLRDPAVQDRDAFYTPDGTTVVILDNVQGVNDIPRILAHEIVGHGGPNGEFGGRMGAQVVFAENIRAKEFEKFKQQIVDGDLDFVKAGSMEDVNRNLGEVFAHYASQNLDSDPSVMNKLVSAVNTAARKLKLRKTYSASDVKVMMKRWRDAVKGEGGAPFDMSDGSPRFDFFPAEPAEAPAEATGEGGEARTGVEPSTEAEATAATPAPSEAVHEEPRRMTSAQEVIATAKTPFNEAERAALEAASDVSGIDATDEVPAQGDFLSILSKDAPVVRLNPAKVDRSDSVLPNMKKDANRTSGITKPLSGEWHPTMGGIGAAWLTKDGKLVVITGRHRSELAERKGKSMLYYLYREADGFTKDDALIYDAVANIHDEKGTINDYLGFLDRINPTREQAEKAGILSGKGLVAWSLYKDATEAVRSATALDGNPGEGQISPQQATVIAQAAPRDADKRNPSIQRQLLRTALGGMRGKAFDMYARIRAEELSKTPVNSNLLVGEQMDLFSSPEDLAADILAQRQSQYRTKKAQGYQTVAQNLRAALNKEGKLELTDEYAKDLGVTDKGDRKQLEAAYEKALERANYWENAVRLEDADKEAMNAEINAAADAKAKKLAELKARREAAKGGKPAQPAKKPEQPAAPPAEPPKNAPVSAPAKEPTTTPQKPAEAPQGGNPAVRKELEPTFGKFMSIMDDLGYGDTYRPSVGGALPDKVTRKWMKSELDNYIEMAKEEGEPLWEDVFGENKVPATAKAYKAAVALSKKLGAEIEKAKAERAAETKTPVLETESPVSETEQPKTRTPSIKMKDEAAERLAQKQENDLAALFDTPELGIIDGDEGKHRLRGRPSGLVDKLFHPFSSFLSSRHGVEVDRRIGTPVEIGVIRDVFEAFAPDAEQRALASTLFDVAEKLGVDFRIDHRQPTDVKGEQGNEIGGHVTFHADELDKRFGKEVCNTILHEITHGVTSYAIDISVNEGGVEGVAMPHALHDAVRRLRAAFRANRDLLPGDDDYKNLHEFAARLTEPNFRAKLERRGWFRRIIDAIIDMFKALLGKPKTARANAEYDRAIKALRDIVKNYDKTAFDAERAAAEDALVNPNYSIRKGAPPKKTGIGYKVFVRGKDGKLYPPMVANPNGEATPTGVWLNADEGVRAGKSSTGRDKVKAGGKGTNGGGGTLAWRPGWHLGEIPYALQFNIGPKVPNPLGIKNQSGEVIKVGEFFPGNFVWAEVEYAADVDYQDEAMSYGKTASGKFNHALAGLPRLPVDGSYKYRTNANPATDPWIITGAMKVNRVLSNDEVDEIVRAAGREPQKRESEAVQDFLAWAKKWKLDPSKESVRSEWEEKNGVSFDTKDFDPDMFQKRVGAIANLVKTYRDSGVADFNTLATRMAERFPEKFDAMKPYLRGVWNAVADQMGLTDISRGEAEKVYGTIEAKAKEAANGAGEHGDNGGVRAPADGGERPGGVLAGGPGRPESPDARVGGVGAGDVPGQPVGLAETGAPKEQPSGGGATSGGNGAVADSAEHAGGEREAGGDSSAAGSEPVARVKKSASKAADKTKVNPSRADFTMTPAVEAAILEKKTAQRVRNNLEAIKLIRDLKARDYAATPAEQATLAKFVGWGGLREDVFGYSLEHAYDIERSGDPEGAKRVLRRDGISQSAYDLHKELRQVLNDNEYESAKASSSTAFYTPVEFVRILHGALRDLGVKGGRFLGPSAGTGNFASAAGQYEKPVNWQFVEKDTMTGELLKALFPNQRVTIGGFEETKFPDGFFDFAIDNVPYADVPISDRSLSSRMFKIHDYFFAKTLAKLRPGGVMAFLTSTGTLDKTSPILRQFLTEHGGKIVGAVRLPNGFFAENAGTDAASDLVIVQRVDGRPDNSAFERGEQYGTTTEYVRRKGNVQKPLTYNGYFKDHPEQVIGKMEVASGRFGPTLKFTMPEGGNLWDAVREAVKNAFAGVDSDAMLKSSAVAEPKERAPIYDDEGLRQGNVTMKDGKPFIKSGDMLEPITLPNDRTLSKELAKRLKSPRSIMDGLLGLRKAMRDVIDAQMSDSDIMETDLAPLLAKLNEVYDAFVKKNGTLHDKWITPFVMLDKADGNRLLALERTVKDTDGKPKIVKSDIFTKRVISRGQRATKADTPKDALVISYSETGGIDVPRIAELLGVSPDEAVAKLKEGGDAFENPQTGRLEPSWQYLSGRVRAKLAAARAAVEAGEESYRANVEALEKVQPPMVRLEDAEIKFGATWVDTECMKDFLRDAFGSEHMRITLGKNEVTGDWNIEFGRVMNEDAWGETSWDANEFIKRVLNHGSLNAYVTDPVTKKRYLNERQTEANKLAAEKLHSAFSQFIQSSEKWAEPSYERYNAVMTDMVDIKLPNNVLPFRAAGMSEDALGKIFEGGDPNKPKKGREYQSAVIARGVLGGNSLCLAHCVGAGKTLEMQSIGILGRHLGLFKKPMYVVPNHMLEQFTNEFMEAFPNANILKMSAEDVKPENRRAFFAQVANGDWDAIVVKHSTFSKKLAMSAEYQKKFIEEQIGVLESAIEAMREAGEKISVNQATKKKESLEAKLNQLANAENHDSQIVPFEELGVDQLFVDEAHNFKGMAITTRQSRTGGLGQGDSQRAMDMEMKTQYVQSLHGGERGVVFATGTPLSNAPVVESYVMLKYLAPKRLEEQGLLHFDDFVAAFGRITTEVEFSLDGKTTKEKEKISAFVNIPELMKLFRSTVDIVNPDQLDIPRPKPKYNMIDVDMSPAQEAIMEMVAREAAIPGGREHPNKFLDLSAIAKMACLTPRLLGYEDGGNKVIRAVAEIKRVYDETSDNRGAQLVFTDIFNESATRGAAVDGYMAEGGSLAEGVPEALAKRSGGTYNLNEEMRDLLIAAGVPASEIAIIQDIDSSKGDKDANKGALFAKVRSGEVRILIGSRPKMGEGTNVQERLAAIHLLHPGWKPAEDEQAIGRIIRFGNTYKEGQIFYYLTKGNSKIGSYETKNHQLVGGKGKLIDQVMHGDEAVREIDMDESALNRDMLMGLASGNKALMELIDVKKLVHKLELNTESTMTSARRNKDKAEANARILERRREEFEKEQEGVAEWREKNDGKPFALSTPDGRTIEKVKDMADYVAAQMVKQLTKDRYERDERFVLGDFNGVEMVLTYDPYGDEKFRLAVPLLGVAREINYSGFIPEFSQNTMTAFKGKIFETVSPEFAEAYKNQLADMDRQAKKMLADADRLQKEYERMRNDLIKMRARQAQLERAVTPMLVQTVADHKVSMYGNWTITKQPGGAGYVASRESDAKSLSAKTVKELLPLMDAEDFASPAKAATKTADLTTHLKPNSNGVYPPTATVSPELVDFDTPDLSPTEEAYGEAEDKTPTEKVMREVYGMTNEEIATALKAAGMEPPKHERKADATAWQQAEALLSNPSYMAKLSRAVAKFPRNIADYENNALNVLFRQRQKAVNDAQSVADGLKETLDAFDAIPKDERDTDFNAERQKTASDYADAKAKLAQAKALMYETGLALTRSSSEAGRRLRSNRGLIDQTDYSYAGISGQVSAILGGADKITPEMDEKIRSIASEFASLDEQGRDLATARLKAQAEKIVQQIKNGDKVRKMAERKAGDEAKRVMRNYNDALAQIEVGAAEVGGTLIGLSDQQYPAWGKWLRALGEYHCFENPDITEEECIKAIVEDISPFIEGADENQVRDALTGFGHNFRQSRYDSQRLMNDLRSQSRLKRQMDWMDETNTMPPLTGMVRDEPSDTTRNLQKQVQERKKEVPDSGRDERRLKGVLESAKTRVKNRIADLENAIATGEKIPGRDRTVPEDMELRDLKKRRDELQKEYDELFKTERGLTDEQRVKLAERLLSREMEHALEDLDRARAGDFSKRPKRPGVESPSIDALRERLAEVRSQIRELKKAKYEFGMTPEELSAYNARKMANREKALARLAERIVSGDISPQKKPQPPMPSDMQKRYDELGEQMNRAHRKLADLRREAADARKPKFVRFIGDAYRFIDGVWKMATASLDFTQVGNQTGSILAAHPMLVAENFAKTLSAFKSTMNAEAIELDLMSDSAVKEAVDNGWLRWKKVGDASQRGDRVELFDAIDKPFTIFGKALRFTDIPVYGKLIATSDRLYATYINAVSASLYSSIVNDPKLFPGGATVFQKKMICDMINVMNGSGTLSKGTRRVAGRILWAPGLVDSQIKRLLGYQIWHPWLADSEEDGSGTFKERLKVSGIGMREFVRSNLGALLLGGLLFALFSTDDQKDEYAHAGVVKKLQTLLAPRIRHTQLDFTGGSVAFLRLANRLISGAYETSTGKTVQTKDVYSELAHFAKGRLTPLVSNFFSWMSGKDYTGQDYGALELLLSFAPISLREAGKSIYENGIEDRAWGTAVLGAVLTMFGVGKGTYRKDDYKLLTNRFLEAMKEYDSIEADELIDEDTRKMLLESIRSGNPLMRDGVREDIAADITRVRKDEARVRRDEKKGLEQDDSLLSDIEREKAAIIEKIRSKRK